MLFSLKVNANMKNLDTRMNLYLYLYYKNIQICFHSPLIQRSRLSVHLIQCGQILALALTHFLPSNIFRVHLTGGFKKARIRESSKTQLPESMAHSGRKDDDELGLIFTAVRIHCYGILDTARQPLFPIRYMQERVITLCSLICLEFIRIQEMNPGKEVTTTIVEIGI